MALIKCPECGKEISSRAKACIYCGFPLEEEQPREEVYKILIDKYNQASEAAGALMAVFNCSYNEAIEALSKDYVYLTDNIEEAKEYYKKLEAGNWDIDISLVDYSGSIVEDNEQIYEVDKIKERELRMEARKIPHCPYCGSESIQAVSRKWSFMRGIATNKVDRICLNCGRKF